MTLQEVGQIEGVTRERVRQIESKLLKILPEFDDVKAIKKIILDYDIKENEFVEYFHEPKEIYQFVILKSKKNVCNRPFEEYLLNVNKTNPQLIKETLKKKKKFINYNGEIIDLDINNVINQVLFNDQNIYTISKLQDAIKLFLTNNGFDEEKMISLRALEGRVAKNKHVIHGTRGKFRYYQYGIDDLNDSFQYLDNLFNVADGIYSIDYFFKSDQMLMQSIDVRNGPELANILKKIGYQKFERLNGIVRQSQVYVGSIKCNAGGQYNFYESILQQFDDQPLLAAVDYIHDNYYIQKSSALAYISKAFSSIIHENRIVLNVPLPSDNSFYENANKILKKPIYSFEQVNNLLRKIDKSVTPSPQLIDKLGFYDRGSTIVNKKFSNQDEAFKSLWLTKDYVFSNEIKEFHNRIADFKAYQLEKSHDLIKIDSNRYMTIKKFEESGLGKEDIKNFLNQVLYFTREDEFYSWKSIINKGFDSNFINKTSFDDYFYERLLFTSPDIRTIQTSGFIFINAEKSKSKRPSLIKFIEHELGTV